MSNNILSTQDKMKIIEEAKYNGVVNTCQKYGICHVNYYNWVKKIVKGEELALSSKKQRKSNNIQDLTKENETLKKMIEEKDNAIQQLLNLMKLEFNPTSRYDSTYLPLNI